MKNFSKKETGIILRGMEFYRVLEEDDASTLDIIIEKLRSELVQKLKEHKKEKRNQNKWKAIKKLLHYWGKQTDGESTPTRT